MGNAVDELSARGVEIVSFAVLNWFCLEDKRKKCRCCRIRQQKRKMNIRKEMTNETWNRWAAKCWKEHTV